MFRKQKVNAATHAAAAGCYVCAHCGAILFEASKKFDSGTGFPSFWQHYRDHVRTRHLTTYGRDRLQLQCARCHAHLGHLFPDARTPTGVRYCVNAAAIAPALKGTERER